MSDIPAQSLQNQTITKTVTVIAPEVRPNPGLFQPTYPLTEADFLRLGQSSPVIMACSGAITSFALAYALPVIVRTLRTPVASRVWSVDDLIVAGVSFLIGIALFLVAFLVSKGRRRVLKSIEAHFEANPGQHEVRTSNE